MKKKVLALLLCLTVAFAFAACGSSDDKSSEDKEKKTEQSAEEKEKEKAEKLDKEYKAVLDKYDKDMKDAGKKGLEGFEKGASAYKTDSKGLKTFYVGERKPLIKLYNDGVKDLEKVRDDNKDEEKNFESKKGELLKSYKAAVADMKTSYKKAHKAAVAAEKEKEEKAKKAAEEKAAKEKAAAKKKSGSSKSSSKKSSSSKSSAKKKTQQPDKFAIAQGYRGKNINSLIAKIGRPSSQDISNSCSETNGKEGYYYWPGFYVMAQSQEQDSPMIIQEVGRR